MPTRKLECPKHDNDGEVKSFHPELAKASLGEGALFFKHRYEIEIIPVSKNNNFSTIATLDAPINLQHMSFKLFKKTRELDFLGTNIRYS